MNLKYYNFQPRLKFYYSLIGLYDFLDKKKFKKNKFFINFISIQNSWFFNKKKINKIDSIIIKEFLSQQKVKLLYENFLITLRKMNFYLTNEFFLNLSIVNSFNKYSYFNQENSIYILELINFFNIFFNHFNAKLFKDCILKSCIFLRYDKYTSQKLLLNYYFLC